MAMQLTADRSRLGASKWVALGVLMLVGLTNYVDRLSISILQVPIRSDLRLSDTQLGAITGLSFSLIYTFAAIPLARIADRLSPKRVIIASLVVWNAMTILCAFATGFATLALFRMGVAVGEAGCGPATQSLLARAFPADQRGRAIAVWQMVFPLGSLLGVAAGGLLSQALGWRQAFIVLGLCGLMVTPLVMLFISDRLEPQPVREAKASGLGFGTALSKLLASRSFVFLLIGGFLAAMPLNAALNWNALFYERAFGLKMSELTLYIAVIAGGGGVVGMVGGGFLSDWLGRRDSRWYCWLPAVALLCALPLMAGQYLLAASPGASLCLGVIVCITLNCWMPPQAAIAQSLVSPDARALAAACILVTAGTGGALGPFLTGFISDLLTARLGADALRYAITLVASAALLASAWFFAAARHLKADLQGAKNAD
jgi:predicted MFS family arabinose efflux permease